MGITLLQLLLLVFQVMCFAAYLITKDDALFIIVINLMIGIFILQAISIKE